MPALERFLPFRHLARVVVRRWLLSPVVRVDALARRAAMARAGFDQIMVKLDVVIVIVQTWHGKPPGTGCGGTMDRCNARTWTVVFMKGSFADRPRQQRRGTSLSMPG
jgi:hypothetical protein